MKHRIVFRADGSAMIGYGHIHRLLSLTRMLYESFDCVFVSNQGHDFLQQELKTLSIPLVIVKDIDYEFPDSKKITDEIKFDMGGILKKEDIVVLDGYWFGKRFQNELKKIGCVLVYIDDLIDNNNIADVVINHSLGISSAAYKETATGTCVYTGSDYCLITVPEKFKKSSINESLFEQLFIAMGGADPLNFTVKVVETKSSFIKRFKKIYIVVGIAYSEEKYLKQITSQLGNVTVLKGLDKTSLYTLMKQSTCAVLSASTMSIEYANIGGALCVIQTAKNQKYLFNGLIGAGVAVNIDKLESINESDASQMILQQKKLFASKPNVHFNRLFKELQIQSDLSFIKAGDEHLSLTYQWASNPLVRAFSFTQHDISFEEHQKWYTERINRPGTIYLLAKIHKKIIGSLRFDISGNNAVISYLIDPDSQGKGMGRALLSKGLSYLADNNADVNKVIGYVLKENVASIKIFERLCFIQSFEQNYLCFTKHIYRYG